MSPPGLSQKSMLYRLGGFAAGNPWRVLAGWAVVIALVVGLWAAFGEGTSDLHTKLIAEFALGLRSS